MRLDVGIGIGSGFFWRRQLSLGTAAYQLFVPACIGAKFPRYPYFSGLETGVMTELYGSPVQLYLSVDFTRLIFGRGYR
jgi:hypothetical protein